MTQVRRRKMEDAGRAAGGRGTRKPSWFRVEAPWGDTFRKVDGVLVSLGLNTVCREARCPNIGECYNSGTATFLILGPVCTRNCAFCNIRSGTPLPVDEDEPARVAEAARRLSLSHVVLTSVTRDDLEDGGASVFAAAVRAIRRSCDASVEVLVPDFGGDEKALLTVLEAGPDVFNHNVETVPRLYPLVRPGADYRRSLRVLSTAASFEGTVVKSGLMVGLGENPEELEQVFGDLLEAGCRCLTIGQYLPPRRDCAPLARYYTPEEFEALGRKAREMGFGAVHSGPLVRSSYKAAETLRELAGTGVDEAG